MKSAHGFTLLELLIGLSLLGFILALLFGGFRIASTSWNAVETRIERSTHEDMAKAFLRRLLSQIQPMRWKQMAERPVTFRGGPDRIIAVAPLTGQAGSSGIRLVTLSIEPDQQGHHGQIQLVFHEMPLSREPGNFTDIVINGKGHILLDGLADVRFAYFGAEQPAETPSWRESWSSKEALPRLVRITLSTTASEPPLDLVVAPMVNGSRCLWDTFYKRCR